MQGIVVGGRGAVVVVCGETVVCGPPLEVVVVQKPRVVEVVVWPGPRVVEVVEGTNTVEVVGWHGTVVVDVLAMQGGSVVDVVDAVGGPVPVVLVLGATLVDVVLEPGVVGPEHPNDCNSAATTVVACGNEANRACTERSASQTRPRTEGSSGATWAKAPTFGVCASPIVPCRNTRPVTTTSAQTPFRRRPRRAPPAP
jgi:hypothetical protein